MIQGVKGVYGTYRSRFLERFENAMPKCGKRLSSNITVP